MHGRTVPPTVFCQLVALPHTFLSQTNKGLGGQSKHRLSTVAAFLLFLLIAVPADAAEQAVPGLIKTDDGTWLAERTYRLGDFLEPTSAKSLPSHSGLDPSLSPPSNWTDKLWLEEVFTRPHFYIDVDVVGSKEEFRYRGQGLVWEPGLPIPVWIPPQQLQTIRKTGRKENSPQKIEKKATTTSEFKPIINKETFDRSHRGDSEHSFECKRRDWPTSGFWSTIESMQPGMPIQELEACLFPYEEKAGFLKKGDSETSLRFYQVKGIFVIAVVNQAGRVTRISCHNKLSEWPEWLFVRRRTPPVENIIQAKKQIETGISCADVDLLLAPYVDETAGRYWASRWSDPPIKRHRRFYRMGDQLLKVFFEQQDNRLRVKQVEGLETFRGWNRYNAVRPARNVSFDEQESVSPSSRKRELKTTP